jgi:hypothetical protein
MIRGKAVTVDVCFSCQWRERFESEVTGNEMVKGMQYGKALRSPDWKGIYKDRDFLELLGMFYRERKQEAGASQLGKGH